MTIKPELNTLNRANPKPIDSYPLISDWIKFNSNKTVTVYTGRVELGQGVTEAFTQIAAQALSVSSNQIQLISGDTKLCPNEGYTAASLSIGDGGMSIRVAATAARQLFSQALSKQLPCEPNELSIRGGEFFHCDTRTTHSYWTMASTLNLAVAIPSLSLTHCAEGYDDDFDSLSFSENRLMNLLSGNTYIHDMQLPGMLHARIFPAPHPLAQLNVNTDELSRQLPDDVCLVRINQFIALLSANEWTVTKTVKQIEDSYEHHWQWSKESTVDGNQIDTLDLLSTEVSQINNQLNSDTQATNTESGKTISVSIARPCLLHASIGPSCAVAMLSDSLLTVWTHSQGVFQLRGAIANVLNMDESQIHIVHTPGAGCYGHNGADDAAADAAILALRFPDKPIRVLYSRKNESQHGTLGPAMRSNATALLTSASNISSLTIAVTSPPHSSRPRGKDEPNLRSAYLLKDKSSLDAYQPFSFSDPPQPIGGALRNAVPGYNINAVELRHHKITKLPYRASAIRSLGAYTNVMAIESLMDECAHHINISPIEFRLNHLEDKRATAVINNAVQQSGWNGAESGFGLAYSQYKNSAAYCACVVKLEVDEEINVQNIWISVDVGEVINADGVKAQMEGGAIQAVSWTLLEQANLIENKVGVNGWEDYPVLCFSDVPEIDVQILPNPTMPTLGCGEAAQGPVGAAILNAVRSILEFRPTRLPLTRDSLIDQIGLDSPNNQ
ncbi:MAG: molybdopterin-dependent oxidoreductase [Granulosicoccus sp.]|nr:molybdopterin-dependent oxidoreductase [Granulosicoccus sp.]